MSQEEDGGGAAPANSGGRPLVGVGARSSPRPWRISPDSDQGVVDAEGRLIFVAMSPDAALIVAAVNRFTVTRVDEETSARELEEWAVIFDALFRGTG